MSQDAINASAQNAVVAINALNKFIDTISVSLVASTTTLADINLKQFGTTNSSALVGPSTLPLIQTNIYDGTGTLVRISVIKDGTSQGYIYDRDVIVATTQYLCAIPNTIGIYEVHLRFSTGLVIEPGLDQTVLVSYSPD
jgi:hypothetical protein